MPNRSAKKLQFNAFLCPDPAILYYTDEKMTTKKRAPQNRTLTVSNAEKRAFKKRLQKTDKPCQLKDIDSTIFCQDFDTAIVSMPEKSVDLLIVDPPYNLSKNYNGSKFNAKKTAEYAKWFQDIVIKLKPILKPTASMYFCSDWKTSLIIGPILSQEFVLRNRITWEREKGRGAKTNWKNNIEDIWFCTNSDEYFFNVDSVKMKKKVIAPYRVNGKPKGWDETNAGNFRLTCPSNVWTDLTVPFWSMAENTDHPTQKPEKLIAKLILASSQKGDMVFDPFLGSGTTAVVAKKLARKFAGIERELDYCCWTIKRLDMADENPEIQGYSDGVFWERNSLNKQNRKKLKRKSSTESLSLFSYA